ncbi:carbohydrate ABC transporter permease [Paenibacillus sp. HWE-109]|uniref:carbohydrate ABC transporter permease n=1 Tax=Paenibacillus sp. HWE-109 TaxID=1306526 RepID=UPI001EDF9A38|nr:carbohydrate ABC transporter permease [Paenibacillus sp. HWE-109]UKS27246.1 carbohydrate ABC transporter permease [Paenibacillus sp. HWE-109]
MSQASVQNKKVSGLDIFVHLLFIVISILCIAPLILVISVSFSDETSIIANGFKFFPEVFSLKAYEILFKDFEQILRSYGISLFVTIAGSVLSLILIALYAYPLSREDLKYRNAFAFFIFFTMLFNGGLVPWYLVYVNILHLKNTIWSLILPLLMTPFFVIVMRTFFATTIPTALLESAKMDGASELKTFIRIVLPLSLPVLGTIALFNTVNYWNDWFLSLVFISDSHNISLQYLMYKTLLNIQYITSNSAVLNGISSGGGQIDLPSRTLQMAMAVVGIGPVVIAYPFFQRYFVRGLTIGAVKG